MNEINIVVKVKPAIFKHGNELVMAYFQNKNINNILIKCGFDLDELRAVKQIYLDFSKMNKAISIEERNDNNFYVSSIF